MEARGKTANTLCIRSLRGRGRVDVDSGSIAARALAVLPAGAHLLPLTILAVTAIASPLELALGVEQCVFVQLDSLLRVLPAEDTSAFATVVATMEESEWLLTR